MFRVLYPSLCFSLFFFLLPFFIFEQTRSTLLRRERERERERDGWCFYSSQQQLQNDDEHFYYDQEEEQEELVRRRLGGTKKEIESKENG